MQQEMFAAAQALLLKTSALCVHIKLKARKGSTSGRASALRCKFAKFSYLEQDRTIEKYVTTKENF
ncbi:unnamed protein product [Ceratitis capitata]|uniref:(Mediterranean fruit fly) hypothetical protein n=1 Tax=Ceratitis capitata TaxID=7213 RepID=A0A811UZR4_CERCA|nr:unnamed protein product [Ceratitis capitata]